MSVRGVVLGGAFVLLLGACGGGGDGGNGNGATGGSSVEVLAQDIAFEPDELSAPSGPVEITLTNEGMIPHTLLFDDVPGFATLNVDSGVTASGTLDVGSGTYTFYCDVPGHRSAGMEGTITVG